MKFSEQAEFIKQLSDRQVTVQLVLTQFVILFAAILVSLFLFDSFLLDWRNLFRFHSGEWLKYGVGSAVLVLIIDLLMLRLIPKRYYDDGGINEKVFQNRSLGSIIAVTLLVAVCEEMLFRGVIQKEFGYFVASLLFALMHFRYLAKLLLLGSVVFVSFFLGWLFEITDSITVTITTHFIVDVILALWIRYRQRGDLVGAANESR
ncbi:CPBP family intramembrane metalloprotease [Halobacillus salinarum]|uniref:CPBP family intramembrane metalloprotease n=1 Tax=Halobacillus salinarum TaxID=2932257 RepID=A0ABY4EEU3_9BACI|nr:type II CAAX endopeptidase family protein [Halobacillus salinarum]UOQ42676.1 CPBP family intramembrane metalloprotease [Halobacillus salinarum]